MAPYSANCTIGARAKGRTGVAGAPIRRLASGAADEYIGTEVDLGLKYAWTKAADFWIGYSRLWAGEYIDDTGFAEDMDWFFLTKTVNF